MVSESLLEVRDLKKYFPIRGGLFKRTLDRVRAVDGISFSIKKGTTLGLVGESGCGKTTVGRTVLRLADPTSGSVKFAGREIADAPRGDVRELRRRMQIVFQDPMSSLNPRLTAAQILAEPLRLNVGSVLQSDEERAVATRIRRETRFWMVLGVLAAFLSIVVSAFVRPAFSWLVDLALGVGVELAVVAMGLHARRLESPVRLRVLGAGLVAWAAWRAWALAAAPPAQPWLVLLAAGHLALAAAGAWLLVITLRPDARALFRAKPRRVRARVAELLQKVGLRPEHATRFPHEFSGGQRQRIGVARALALNPDFIVLDEPTSALDVSVQAQVLNLLKHLQKDLDLTYLFISHDLSVVRHLCDEVAVMYLGRIVEQGPVADVFERPQHPYTQALLSAVPIPDPTVRAKRIILTGDVPSPVNPPAGCRFNPRCPRAQDICREVDPPLEEKRPSQVAACHFPGDPAKWPVTQPGQAKVKQA